MDRITQKIFGDKVKLPLIPQVIDRATLAEYHDVRKWYESCVISLACYEDTGLTPDEISAMQAENTTLKKKESATSKLFDDFNDSIINTWRDKYRELLSSAKDLQKENATLKKALNVALESQKNGLCYEDVKQVVDIFLEHDLNKEETND